MTERKPRVLFYFLHLLGVGHVHRARQLIAATAAEDIAVDAVVGGVPLPQFDLAAETTYYLPPVRAADASYAGMLDNEGNPLTEAYLKERETLLLQYISRLKPDVVLIEAFPFGRRVVRHEILEMLRAFRMRENPPLVVSSVRDILQENRKPGRLQEARDWVLEWFDHVLVHSDPAVIELDATFSLAGDFRDRTSYTGFVAPPIEATQTIESYDVFVSAGGGAFGGDLMRTAMEVASRRSDMTWCFLAGRNATDADWDFLRKGASSRIKVLRKLDNLSNHLSGARLSISQCGYNTAMDALAAQRVSECRAVFVPYDTTGQTEQLRRAQLLEKAGYAACVPQSGLSPASLEVAVERAMTTPRTNHVVDFNGASNTAKLIKGWIAGRQK